MEVEDGTPDAPSKTKLPEIMGDGQESSCSQALLGSNRDQGRASGAGQCTGAVAAGHAVGRILP